MRVLLTSLAFLSLLTTSVFAADDQAIKDRIDAFQAAWNKHDAKAMTDVFTDDGTLVNPFGATANGHDEILKLFTEEQAHPFKESTYSASEVKVQMVTPDVAVADSTGNITGLVGKDGSASPDFPHHVSYVFVKKDGKWMCSAARAFQFCGKPSENK